MKRMSKSIALLLALAMVLALFAGCGGTVQEVSSAPAEASPVESAEPAAEEPTPAEEAPEAPEVEPAAVSTVEEAEAEPAEEAWGVLDEASGFRFANETMEMPLTEDEVTLTYWTQFMPPLLDYGYNGNEDFPVFQYLEELTGVHVEFTSVSMNNANEQASILIASGDYPDIWNSFWNYYGGTAHQAIEDDIALDLAQYKDDLVNYFGIIDHRDDFTKTAYTDEGEVAFLYPMYRTVDARDGNAIRGDWLEELGMDDPVTFDDYHDVLSAMKDSYGATFYMTCFGESVFTPGFDLQIELSPNASPYSAFEVDEDGTVYYGLATEKYRDYLRFMNNLWNEGLIYSDFATNTAGGVDNGMLINGDFSVLSAYTVTFYGTVESMVGPDSSFYLKSVRSAKNDPDQVFHTGTAPSYITSSGAKILTTNLLDDDERLKIAMQWADFWYTKEGSDICCYGEEGVTYNIVDGEVQFTDVVMHNPDGMAFTLSMLVYAMSNGTFVADPTINTVSFSEVQLAMFNDYVDAKVNGSDYAYALPDYLSLGTAESQTFTNTYTDILTYVQECYLKFINGTMNLEADFDSYVQHLSDMGIETCVDLLQNANDAL